MLSETIMATTRAHKAMKIANSAYMRSKFINFLALPCEPDTHCPAKKDRSYAEGYHEQPAGVKSRASEQRTKDETAQRYLTSIVENIGEPLDLVRG